MENPIAGRAMLVSLVVLFVAALIIAALAFTAQQFRAGLLWCFIASASLSAAADPAFLLQPLSAVFANPSNQGITPASALALTAFGVSLVFLLAWMLSGLMQL